MLAMKRAVPFCACAAIVKVLSALTILIVAFTLSGCEAFVTVLTDFDDESDFEQPALPVFEDPDFHVSQLYGAYELGETRILDEGSVEIVIDNTELGGYLSVTESEFHQSTVTNQEGAEPEVIRGYYETLQEGTAFYITVHDDPAEKSYTWKVHMEGSKLGLTQWDIENNVSGNMMLIWEKSSNGSV